MALPDEIGALAKQLQAKLGEALPAGSLDAAKAACVAKRMEILEKGK